MVDPILPVGKITRPKTPSDSGSVSPLEPDPGATFATSASSKRNSKIVIVEIPQASNSTVSWDKSIPSQPKSQEKSHHHHHHHHHIFKKWPDKPQSLAQAPLAVLAWDFHDIVLCLLPAALIIKAGLCIHASKIDTDHHGPNFDQTSKLTINLVRFNMQLTTLFTIIFVLIIASTVKRFALWKAQQGARLADLEQYNSSISLTATFKAIWSLRAFSWVSLFLLFLWSWYYIGSQASERELTFQESGSVTNLQIAHVSNQATSPFADGPFSSFPTVKRTDLTSRYHLYVGRVETGVSKSPFDINGYPLTPYYDNTPANRLDPKTRRKISAQGWLDTTEFSLQHVVNSIGTTLYTNFADQNSAGYSSNWFDGKIIGDFTYETTNFLANCSRTTLLRQTTYPGLSSEMTLSLNMTNATGPITADTVRSFNVWEQFNQTHSLQATCNITEISTDVKVRCTAAGCKAVAVRPTPNIPYPRLRTPFDSDAFAAEFFDSLLYACGRPDSRADLTLLEANNGWEPLKAQLNTDQARNLPLGPDLNLDAYAFSLSIGLTNHINTFYSASMYMKYEHNHDLQLTQASTFTIDPNDANYTFIPVRGAEVSLRYELSPGWIATDMISNFILLLAAMFAFWLRRQTLAPDLFGYVSSLTRDNPHLQLPTGGSALSGMERARRLKNFKVKLGDMGSLEGDNVGRIVMVHDQEEVKGIRPLQRTRSYA